MRRIQSPNRSVRVGGFGLLFCSLVACSAILGLPSPTLDDSIGGDGGPDAQTGDSPANVDGGDAPQTCGNVTTDRANCGACGHDCTGGKCINGLCELTGFLDGPIELCAAATMASS